MENFVLKLKRLKDSCDERSERLEVANEKLKEILSECETIKLQTTSDLSMARSNLEKAALRMKIGIIILLFCIHVTLLMCSSFSFLHK